MPSHGLVVPQVSGASVPRPPLAFAGIKARFVQTSAGVRFQVVHHTLGRGRGSHDNVKVIGANVQRMERPTAELAVLPDGRQYHFPTSFIQGIGLLDHPLTLRTSAILIRRQAGCARNVVIAIHRA
jgi:hypothetical protein